MQALPNTIGEIVVRHTIYSNAPPLTDAVIVSSDVVPGELAEQLRRAQYEVEAWFHGSSPAVAVIAEGDEPIAEIDMIHFFGDVYWLKPSAFEALDASDCVLMNKTFYTINLERPMTFKFLNAEHYRALSEGSSFVAAVIRKRREDADREAGVEA